MSNTQTEEEIQKEKIRLALKIVKKQNEARFYEFLISARDNMKIEKIRNSLSNIYKNAK